MAFAAFYATLNFAGARLANSYSRRRKQIKPGFFDDRWDLSPGDSHVQAWEAVSDREKPLWDMRMATYAAMVDCMDQGVGKILKALGKNNAADDTVVIFISDNGACAETAGTGDIDIIGAAATSESYRTAWANAGNTPFRLYKSYVHEGGVSSPLIIRRPQPKYWKVDEAAARFQPSAFSSRLALVTALGVRTNTVSILLMSVAGCTSCFIVIRLNQLQISCEKKPVLQLTCRSSSDKTGIL